MVASRKGNTTMKKYTEKEKGLINMTFLATFFFLITVFTPLLIPRILHGLGVISNNERGLMVFAMVLILLILSGATNVFGNYFWKIMGWLDK